MDIRKQKTDNMADEKKLRLMFSSLDNGYDYESYKEYCEEEDEEPSSPYSWEYLEWVADMTECDKGDLLDNIENSGNNGRCVITGRLGLWDKRPTIKEVVCDSLVDAIERCDTEDYVEVYEDEENECVQVRAIHHDGTNIFLIYPINEEKAGNLSNEEIEEDDDPMQYTKKYPKYIY